MARSGQPLTFHGRNQALDGVRAAAVLAVMAYHASGSPFRGGYLGVDVFFVLSGFLITLVLLGDVQRCGHIRLGRFFVRRIARVMPAYLLLVAIVTASTFVFSRAHARHALAAALPWLLSLTANWREAGHPGTLGYLTPLWSLSVEMQFYLLWPFVFGLALRSRMTRPAILWSLCLVIVASSLWKGYLVLAVPHGGPRAYYGSDTRADELLIGATAALLLAWGYLRDTPVLRRWVSRITYLTLSFFAVAVFAPVDDSTWPWVGGLTILAAGLAVVIVGLVSGLPALR